MRGPRFPEAHRVAADVIGTGLGDVAGLYAPAGTPAHQRRAASGNVGVHVSSITLEGKQRQGGRLPTLYATEAEDNRLQETCGGFTGWL